MGTNNKVIIIDNEESWRNEFARILNYFGDSRGIVKVGYEEFIKNYSEEKNFDHIDLCLVDLELGPSVETTPVDTDGLDKVLPHIRDIASWIPVACISRFITGESEIVGILSVSDFDGFYPKKTIFFKDRIDPDFNVKKWETINIGLMLKRISALTGRGIIDPKNA